MYCFDYIKHKKAPKEKDEKCFHCWAVVSYGFKLDLIFDNVSEKINGKILLKVYRDQIFKLVVNFWLLEDQDFVLKEEGNNAHKKVYNWNIV